MTSVAGRAELDGERVVDGHGTSRVGSVGAWRRSVPLMGVANCRKGKTDGETGDVTASDVDDLDTVAGVDRRRGADHRPHRCRDLHRLGHPRLPRPERCLDEESRRPRRRRRSSTTSPIPRSAGRRGATAPPIPAFEAEPNRGHDAIVELQRRGKLHAVVTQNVDGLHQKAGTDDRAGRRGPRHDVVDAVLGLRRPPADGRGARRGSGPVRRIRRASSAAASSRATRSPSARRSCRR